MTETWVSQNLDPIIKEFVNRWLHLHQGANCRHLYLLIKKLGLKFSLPSDIYRFCQLSNRKILRNSMNDEIKELYKLTTLKHQSEERLLNVDVASKSNETIEKIVKDLIGLKEQNTIMENIQAMYTISSLTSWQQMCDRIICHLIFLYLPEKH